MLRSFSASSHQSWSRQLARDAGIVLIGSLLLAISAKVQVPFWPVPMTMQTLVVLMIGAHAGVRLAGTTVLAYLIEGAVGLPVFSTGAGLAFMAGPTGGYLAGFLASAIFISVAMAKGYGRTWRTAIAVLLIGDAIILSLGYLWLATILGADKAFNVGVLPFLPAEALKVSIVALSVIVLNSRSQNAQ